MSSEVFSRALAQEGHAGGVASVVLALTMILGAAKLAGHLAVQAGQPAVLGELIAGVILGNAAVWERGFFRTKARMSLRSSVRR